MFYITWDRETGGVLLDSHRTKETLGITPRPVFCEELDMLKLNELGWTYPHCKEPLLWACNKKYYYCGEFVFEAKGANLYTEPTIIFQENCENLTLTPVDVETMLKRCKDFMFLIESEALEFIRNTYIQYSKARESVERVKANQLDYEAMVSKLEKETKQKMAIVKQDCDSFDIMPLETAKQAGKQIYQTTKIDVFLASFSGGKDSQVVLDLCTRAIPPSDFEVIYSDTGYELPTSLELYEEVKKHYHKLYPELRFRTARNHENVLNYWDKIGTPSDTHRWCCSVMKTAPLYRLLKVEGTNKQAKVLTFDGVRAEESTRRSSYARIGRGVKHSTVINASPILYWNTIEIFLYIFKYNLPINPAYRQGMTRVGCVICPFSSDWNEMIASKFYADKLQPFLERLEFSVKNQGVKDVENYIGQGNWKRRAGGRGMQSGAYMEILSIKPDLKIKCYNPNKDILSWFNALANFSFKHSKGEFIFKNTIYSFTINKKENLYTLFFPNTYDNPTLQGLLKRVFYKATYCVNCESCDVECPMGALTTIPDVSINKTLCIHCHKCLVSHPSGCIAAFSLKTTDNNNKMKLIGYNNFGLREEWLDVYLSSPETYFTDNIHGLNPKEQLPSFVKWIYHAGIIDDTKTKNLTELGNLLKDIHIDMSDLVWEIVWINLTKNSPIAKWYIEHIDWNYSFNQQDIRELVSNDYPNDSPTTIRNVLYALFRTFNESPIGRMGLLKEIDKLKYIKTPYNDVSTESIAYSMYKFGEEKNITSFRVNDLYLDDCTSGIFKEFGIDKNTLETHLRALNSKTNRVLIAELNMGLDNITLREDLDAISALSILLK